MAFLAFWFFSFCLIFSSAMVIIARNPVHSVLYLILCFFNAAALFLLLGAEFLAMLLVIVYVGAVAVLFLFVVMMLDIKERPQEALLSAEKGRQAWQALKDLIIYSFPFLIIFVGGGIAVQYIDMGTYFKTMQGQVSIAVVLFLFARFAAVRLTKVSFFEGLQHFFKVTPLPLLLGCIIIAEILVLITANKALPLFQLTDSDVLTLNTLNTTLLGHVLYTQYLLPFLLAGFILLVAMIGAIVLTLRVKTDSKRQKIRQQISRNKDNSIDLVDVPLNQGLSTKGENV